MEIPIKDILHLTRLNSSLIFFSISLFSSIGILMLMLLEKKNRDILAVILLISVSMSGYLLLNSLLKFYGTDFGDPMRVENNKSTIILISKLEIIALIMGIIFFSSLSPLMTKSTVTKIKLAIVTLVGVFVAYLDLFSDKFFLKDTLKVVADTYMAKEGPLFDIFVAYFAASVFAEVMCIIASKKKVQQKYEEIYNYAMYGFISIIFFGTLEALELYRVTKLYEYFPSLLGIGITIFSLTILALLVNKYSLRLVENNLLVKALTETHERLEQSNTKISRNISEALSSINTIEREVKDMLNLPDLANSLAQKMIPSFENIKTTVLKVKEKTLPSLKYLTNTLDQLKSGLSKIQISNVDKTTSEVLKREKEITTAIKNLLPFNSKREQAVKFLSSIVESISNLPEELNNLVKRIEIYTEDTKVQLVNLIIVSEKKGKDTRFFNIFAEEMLEKVVRIKNHLNFLLEARERITEVQNSLNLLLQNSATKLENTFLSLEESSITNTVENLNLTAETLSKTILRLMSFTDKISSSSLSIENTIEKLEKNINEIFALVQEVQTMCEYVLTLSENLDKVTTGLEYLRGQFEELKSKLSQQLLG